MKILLLAPHPYYQDRGTPIAVDLLIQVLTEKGHQVDCLCFNEGRDRQFPNFRLFRARSIPEVQGIRPGFSAGKLYIDLFFFFRFFGLFLRNRYDVVHAVEESAFMAMVVCKLFGRRFIYDMDSSMATQLVDRSRKLQRFEGVLRWLESLPMRTAKVVVPVCEALAVEVRKYRNRGIFILKDVSLVNPAIIDDDRQAEDLRRSHNVTGPLLMYIGNLESYQGIDLMIEGFALAATEDPDSKLIIIGGEEEHIEKYREKVQNMALDQRIILLGKRPVSMINAYMKQADLLLSPRTQGVNTPMKVYSYLDSGVAVLATRLPTHTQVMTDDIAFLAGDTPPSFARAIQRALASSEEREKKAAAARSMIAQEHSLEAFRKRLGEIYAYVERDLS